MKDLSIEELKAQILKDLYYNATRMYPRYNSVSDYSENESYMLVIKELEEEEKITISNDKEIINYINMEKFLNPSNIEFAIGTLNRAKLIIDEYNEKLNNEGEYGHVSILRDIEKSIKKLEEEKSNV